MEALEDSNKIDISFYRPRPLRTGFRTDIFCVNHYTTTPTCHQYILNMQTHHFYYTLYILNNHIATDKKAAHFGGVPGSHPRHY